MKGKWRLPMAIVLTTVLSSGAAFAASPEENSEKMLKQAGFVAGDYVFKKAPFPSCHASTVAETPNGLVAAWFGGKGEGNEDVGIWSARKDKGAKSWTAPVRIEKEPKHPNWNPVLFQRPGGELMLLCKAGPNPGSWWGVLKKSKDGGKTWSEGRKLPKHTLGFIHGPIRAKPVLLKDGRLLCGSSTEHKGWRVHFEWTSDWGKTWDRTPAVNDGKKFGAIQPTFMRHKDGSIQALCRSEQQKIVQVTSKDGGKTWSEMTATELPNPNAGIDAVTLADGRQLLIYNHTTRSRRFLNLAITEDGKSWKAAGVVEDQGGEYSYPAMIQTSDGLVHMTYTWRRNRIRHVVVDPAKLKLRDIKNGKWPSPKVVFD